MHRGCPHTHSTHGEVRRAFMARSQHLLCVRGEADSLVVVVGMRTRCGELHSSAIHAGAYAGTRPLCRAPSRAQTDVCSDVVGELERSGAVDERGLLRAAARISVCSLRPPDVGERRLQPCALASGHASTESSCTARFSGAARAHSASAATHAVRAPSTRGARV